MKYSGVFNGGATSAMHHRASALRAPLASCPMGPLAAKYSGAFNSGATGAMAQRAPLATVQRTPCI
jgi:hypothetical protein